MQKNRDLELLYELGTLRHVHRVWTQFHLPDVANLAEHHFRVCWIALILAKMEGATNTDKILKMALVHDLSESRTGDAHRISKLYVKRDEDGALAETLKNTGIGQEMLELWREYEKKQSIEARIVKDADYLDLDLELQEQGAQGHKVQNIWSKHRPTDVHQNLYTESAKKLAAGILSSNPFDWFENAEHVYKQKRNKNA